MLDRSTTACIIEQGCKTIAEVSRTYGISTSCISRLISSRQIIHFKPPGGAIVIPVREVIRILEEGARAPSEIVDFYRGEAAEGERNEQNNIRR